MKTKQLLADLESLTPEEARTVAELIAFFKYRHQSAPPNLDSQGQLESDGATILPPLDLSNAPITWPENPFADPEFYGMWADREDMKDGGAAYIHAVRRGLRPPR